MGTARGVGQGGRRADGEERCWVLGRGGDGCCAMGRKGAGAPSPAQPGSSASASLDSRVGFYPDITQIII